MVKRYPHTAIITIKTEGVLVDGEWVEGGTQIVEVDGRYDPLSTNNVIRQNANGDEIVVHAEFYTQHVNVAGAVSLEIASLGIKRNIICWWPYQTHSVISV